MASKDLVKGYCKESKCEYDVYTKEKMDELLEEISTGMTGDEYNSSSTYFKGDLIIYNNTLYKCNTDITTAEEWNASHWTATSLSNEIKNKQDKLIFDTVPTDGSTNPVTSGGVYTSLDNVYSKDNVYNKTETNNMLSNKVNTSDAILKGQMRFLDGNVYCEAESNGVAQLTYPDGFNKNNCILIAFASSSTTSEYKYGHTSNTSYGIISGTNDSFVTLGINNIIINFTNIATTEKTYYFRIVLLKTS